MSQARARGMRWPLVAALLATAAPAVEPAKVVVARPEASTPNLLANGSFESDRDHDDRPDAWETRGVVDLVKKQGGLGRAALALYGTAEQPDAQATQRVAVAGLSIPVVTVAGLVKAEALTPVAGGDGEAQVVVTFYSEQGEPLGKPETLGAWTDTPGWRPWAALAMVPPGASTMDLALHLRGAAGQVLFDDVVIVKQLPDDHDTDNLIVDGGFDYPGTFSRWSLGEGQKIQYPGFESRAALKLQTPKAGGPAAVSQRIALGDGAEQATVTLRGMRHIKRMDDVADGGGVVALMRFADHDGRAVGSDERIAIGSAVTKGWSPFQRGVAIPAGAETATLELAIDGARGTALIDDVVLEATTAQGVRRRLVESRTDTSGWRAFAPVDGPLADPLDASGALDAPAGAHGFVTVKDGHFAFADGTPVRFFGVNLDGTPALPSHGDADRLAERLAQLGCNIVRLHHLDAPWVKPNLFDPAYDDTQHLLAESLDRLDYLIAQLKARGVYIYLDLHVSRKFKAGDGVAAFRELSRGGKIVALVDPRIIALQQQYARDLLTHENPYTKTRLVDEPAIALMEIINENSLFKLPKQFKKLPAVYQDALRERWAAHLAERGVERSEQAMQRLADGDDPDVQRFFAGLQRAYFQRMRAFLRELGVKAPLAGSNFGLDGLDLVTNAELDFVDRHAYWDPPHGDVDGLPTFQNRSPLQTLTDDHPLVKLSRLRVAGQPFVVGEWNIDWPNEFRAAGPLMMTAYALFQGWDALIQFNYDGHLMPRQIASRFDVSTKPELFLQLPTAAHLFHDYDVAASTTSQTYPLWPVPEIPKAAALLHGLARVGDAAVASATAEKTAAGPWVSDTGELAWDAARGILRINTPIAQAVLGHVGGQTLRLRDVTVSVATPFACLAIISVDDLGLETSRRMLLTTVARVENTGMVYDATRTFVRDEGHAPILMEPVTGALTLALHGRAAPSVFALDAAGHRMGAVEVQVAHDAATIPLGRAALYEIVVPTT